MADCTLQATARPLTGAVQVRYELTNTAAVPLYLFNKLGKIGGRSVLDIDPNTANVVLHPDRVVVGKALVPVPDDKEVEREYVPGISRVAPGGTFAEQFVLPLPLAPFTWYESRWLRSAPVTRPLFLELGYALASPRTEEFIHPLNGPAYHASWFPLELQKLISSGPLLDVSVLSQP